MLVNLAEDYSTLAAVNLWLRRLRVSAKTIKYYSLIFRMLSMKLFDYFIAVEYADDR